jgi:hypothetical protein
MHGRANKHSVIHVSFVQMWHSSRISEIFDSSKGATNFTKCREVVVATNIYPMWKRPENIGILTCGMIKDICPRLNRALIMVGRL